MTRIAEWFSAFIGLLETPAGLQETMGVHAPIDSPAVVVSPRSVLDIYEESISAVRNDVELYFLDKMKEHEKAAEAEKQYFHEIADIREELSMIQSVFSQQERVWSELRVNILSYDGAPTAQDVFLMECNQEKIVEELFLQMQELEKSGKLDGTLEISPAAEVVADKLFSRLHRLKGDSQTKTSEYIAAKLRFRLCKLEFGKCNKEFLGRFTSMLIYNSQTYQRQKEESFVKAKDITNKVSTQLQRLKDRIEKADQSAERVQNLIPQYLELKRSATSMKEAHYTAVLGAAMFGLSFVTSVFTPMSFILALLAVPKDSVLVDPQPDGHKGHFVRRWAGITEGVSLAVAMIVTIEAWWVFSRTSGLQQRKGRKDVLQENAAEEPPVLTGGNTATERSTFGPEGKPAARATAVGQDDRPSDAEAPGESRGGEPLVAGASQSSGRFGLLRRGRSPTDVEQGRTQT